MPVKLKYVENGVGVEYLSEGIVTGEEVIEACKKVYAPESLLCLRYQLIDRTNCSEYNVTPKDTEAIAFLANVAAKIKPGLIVALVSTDPLQYGMTRMWQTHMERSGYVSEIFKDRPSAEAWIREQLARADARKKSGP
jgi:hypothetical protein